jgi:hypothetical protein
MKRELPVILGQSIMTKFMPQTELKPKGKGIGLLVQNI